MAIKLKKVNGGVTLSELRGYINENSEEVESLINSLLEYSDISSDIKTLKGWNKLEIFNGQKNQPNTGTTAFETNSSIKVDGNITNNSKFIGKTVELSNGTGLKVNNGSVIQLDSETENDFRGNIKSSGAFIDKSIGTSLDAYKKSTYESGGNNFDETSDPTYVVGHITVGTRSSIILNFNGYTNENVNYNVNKVKLLTTGIESGHRLTVIVKMDDSLSNDFWIVRDTLYRTTAYDFETGVKFNKSGQTAEFMFDGTKWILLNNQGSVRD